MPKTAVESVAKKPRKTTKSSAAAAELVPLAGSPAAARDEKAIAVAYRKLGEEMLATKGRAPFSIPDDFKVAKSRIGELNEGRESELAELAALLYAVEQKGWHRINGFASVADYAEQVHSIHGPRARTLAAAYGHYHDTLGLPDSHLGGKNGVAFSKFLLIAGAVSRGDIGKKDIVEWLPKLRKHGAPGSYTHKGLQDDLKQLKAATPGELTVTRRFALVVPAEMYEGLEASLAALKEALKVESDGVVVVRALAQMASGMIADSGQAATRVGLRGLREITSALAPVYAVYWTEDDRATEDALHVPPVRNVFMSFEDNTPVCCLAVDAQDAAATLNVEPKAVRSYPLQLSDNLKPTMRYVEQPVSSVVSVETETHGTVLETTASVLVTSVETKSFDKASDIGRSVKVKTKKGDAFGTILDVNAETRTLKVGHGVGRPRVVSFNDAEFAEIAAAVKPARRGRKATAAPASASTGIAAPAPLITEADQLIFTAKAEVKKAWPSFQATQVADLLKAVQAAGTAVISAGHQDWVDPLNKEFARLKKAAEAAGSLNAKGEALHAVVDKFFETAARAGVLEQALSAVN